MKEAIKNRKQANENKAMEIFATVFNFKISHSFPPKNPPRKRPNPLANRQRPE